VAVGYLGLTVFHEESGPLNLILAGAGLPGVPWLSSGAGAFVSLLLADAWQWTPFCFLVLHAALLSQPPDLFEAARLEPLTPWTRFRHLTFPLLRPTLALVALLRFVEALKVVDLPFALTGGGPGAATETLSLLAYRSCMKFFNFGYGSALAWTLFALVLALSRGLAGWHLRRATA
jgi:multiple sugar transport system permease protein